MAEEEDDDTWILDLEAALLETCSATSIYGICKGKAFPESVRPEAWAVCLEIRDKQDQLVRFNEIYDLSEQEELRVDCQNAVEKLGNDEYDKVSVVSDIESILTYYCKCKNIKYDKSQGFIELLLPILALKRPKSETYNIFEAVVDQYVIKDGSNKEACSLFRLLILYHDPELCSFLDTKRVTPDLYVIRWFKTLFSSTCYLKVVQAIWDFYFQQNDPFFIFFLALVIVVNGKEHVVALKDQGKNKIVEMMSAMPAALERDDVADFCSLAQYYALKTPNSFKKESFETLFGSEQERNHHLSQALCLPVSASELVENATESEPFEPVTEDPLERVRFFLVDCRPAEQYNAGHLPTAFHLDCNLMLQEPSAFNVAVQGLLSAQKQSIAANSNAGGEHLCFLGSGRDEEDRYAHMVVASFLQKHTQYISILTGGYQAIHDYFGSDLSDCLEDHDCKKCLVCNPNGTPKQEDAVGNSTTNGTDLFGKISAAVKTKSADFKEKLIEYIVNPSTGNEMERHVSPSDKVGKLYRNLAPVFSIDDENLPDDLYRGDEDEEEPARDVVPLSEYLKSDKTVGYFKCKEVKENGYMYDSYLLVTDSHMIVLRELSHKKGYALLVVKRSLATIVKITSKKKYQNLITFKYGNPDGDGTVISDMDRFFIQKASEATKLVSQQILKSVEAKENRS